MAQDGRAPIQEMYFVVDLPRSVAWETSMKQQAVHGILSRRSGLVRRHSLGWRSGCVWALVLLATSACQSQTQPASAGAANDPGTLVMSRIESEIGGAACTQDSQCRSLGLGHKSCGGPAQWVAWSAKTSDEARLQALATQLAALQRDQARRSGMVSNCMVVPDPGAVCRAKRCVLGAGGDSAR
jgi:hypothetical protein